MNNEHHVCLLLEGSYPYITGGVSSWVHQLIKSIPELKFSLFTISPKKNMELNYQLPENVVGHHNVVINDIVSGKKMDKKRENAVFDQIKVIHKSFKANSNPDLNHLFSLIKEGDYLHRLAVLHDIGWKMLLEGNAKKNPIYAFADYFWAWKSAHDMMFKVIASDIPKADLYHAVSTGYAGLVGIVAKIRYEKPLILTEHGLYHKEREMEIKRASYVKGYQRDMWIQIYNKISQMVYQYSDKIITLFELNRKKEIELGALNEKTIVIPNGIDVMKFTSVKRQKRPGFHVGLVGRVVPIKDIKTFIISCKIILDMIPGSKFYCIGPDDEDINYFNECQILVERLKLNDSFEFTGTKNVMDYYTFLDVVMLTSVREAQPLVILEAYAAGVPVVATRVGNIPELLDYDERLLASPKDPEKLAQNVKWIFDHPSLLRDLIDRNKLKVVKFYDRQEVFRAYYELYRSIAIQGIDSKTRE
ncbi:MAG: GT4 family glycosyltransferase PelF [Spirochaetales bacterium]|nr:GT4 family glycosyltransferase PelF [Spirochaetales bacterium]